ERVDRPLGRVGGDDVEVAVHQQTAAGAVGAGEAGDDVAAPRVVTGFDVGDLVSHFGELAGDVLGGSALALEGLGVAGVRGVDPDQIAGQGGDLFLGQPQSVVLISARYCLGVLAHLAFLSSAR